MYPPGHSLLRFATPFLALLTVAYAASNSCPLNGPVASTQHTLKDVRTSFLNLSQHNWGYPLGITYAKQPGVAFASLSRNLSSDPSTLLVLDTSTFAPTVVQDVSYPNTEAGPEGATGITVSSDGQFSYAAAGHGAFLIDTKLVTKKGSDPIIGFLHTKNQKKKPGDSAFNVVVSHNNDYLFIFQEYGPHGANPGNVDVFKLNPSTGKGKAIGFLPLGDAVTDGVFSPDGKYMYAVSEAPPVKITGNKIPPGTISVLDLAKLEQNPESALLGTIKVDCSAVRVVISSDGSTLWVANRASNNVWALETAKILSDPNNAHIATVDVGTSPVGLILVNDETRLLVANSNRFHDIYSGAYNPKATSGVSVIDVKAALQNDSSANLGQIPSGYFPRNLAVSPDKKTVLVSNWSSQQIMAIDLSSLP